MYKIILTSSGVLSPLWPWDSHELNLFPMLWEGPESICGPSTAMSRLVTRCCEKVLSPLVAHSRRGVDWGPLTLWESVQSNWGPLTAMRKLRTWSCEKVLSPLEALPVLGVDSGPQTLLEGVESTYVPPQPWVVKIKRSWVQLWPSYC